MIEVVYPDWPAPVQVNALVTTRKGGVSPPPFDGLNLGDHVGDAPANVVSNRALLREQFALPAEPRWLQQVHGTAVVDDLDAETGSPQAADAALAKQPGQVCVVMTADCLPVLFCNRQGTQVAAAHAGWRGLADGVLEATLDRFNQPAAEILAWLGPAIGSAAFEVGPEVRACFVAQQPTAVAAFTPGQGDRWYADIYQLARQRLSAAGTGFIGGGDYCTVTDAERFYSYRRDGVTGRMASLIWIADPGGAGDSTNK